MAITEQEVRYVAHLSRLELSEDELARFAAQLDEVLQYVEKLNELDTSQVEPMLHAIAHENVFREDVPGHSLTRDEALGNAPDSSEGCFKVPRIIE